MNSHRATLRLHAGRIALWLAAGLVLAFLVAPLLVVIPLSFSSSDFLIFPPPGWSLHWYENLFTSDQWRSATATSLRIALACTVVSTLIGTCAAFPLVRRRFPGKRLLLIFITSPLIVPEIVIAIGLYFIALPVGATDHWWSVALGQSVLTVPFSTLLVAASLRGFDTAFEDAARSLGANRLQVLRHVTLPGIMPGIVTAAMFTFIFSLNDLLIPLFVAAVRVVPLPVVIWTDIRSSLDLTTLAVSVMWIVLALCVLGVLELMRRRREVAPAREPLFEPGADKA